ncbi:unnamed protein product [Acanthoscelides obtectus]|uniref:Gustatory receptor n=1 Tax=Acanthoscelides obtectus TaxID=200917 RepID=A0A9P0KPV5_ACAOB|nr:unnamed protein product [Acanthoscelides obtectus]CAK1634271.1 hypothetical protein AOBTE_LOCUS8707 [Acanthoscelides obtectus]
MCIALLLKLCKVLVIVPGENYKHSLAYTLYTYTWIVLSLASVLFYIFGQLTNPNFKTMIFTVRILDGVTMALITSSTLCIASKCRLATNLLQHLQLTSIKENNRKIMVGFVLVHIVFIATNLVGDASLSMSIGLLPGARIVKYYILRDMQWYVQTIAVYLVIIVAHKFKIMFEELNVCLQSYSTESDTSERDEKVQLILKLRKRYNHLADLVQEFNDVFGLTIFFAVLFTMAMAVFSIHRAIVFSLFVSDDPGRLWIILASILWTIVVTLQALLLAASCSSMEKEARRTEKICYSLVNEAPAMLKEISKEVVSELCILAQLVGCRKPSVSAAGFFKVNYEMMGFIAATVTSDTIITLQCLIESIKM